MIYLFKDGFVFVRTRFSSPPHTSYRSYSTFEVTDLVKPAASSHKAFNSLQLSNSFEISATQL